MKINKSVLYLRPLVDELMFVPVASLLGPATDIGSVCINSVYNYLLMYTLFTHLLKRRILMVNSQ